MRRIIVVSVLFSSSLLAQNAFVRSLGDSLIVMDPAQVTEVERRELVLLGNPWIPSRQGEFLLVKWDSAGSMMWQKVYSNPSIQYAYALEPIGVGNVIVGAGLLDGGILLSEIGDTGDVLWAITAYGWPGLYEILPRDILTDGAIESEMDILCGHRMSWLTVGPFSIVAYHYASGSLLWAYDYNLLTPEGEIPRTAHSFRRTSDGGFIVTGPALLGYQADIALVRLDPSGNPIWGIVFGGMENEFPGDVIQAWDGTFVVVGSTESFGDDPDIFIANVGLDGQLLWARYIPNTGWSDMATSLIPLLPAPGCSRQCIPLAIAAGQIEMTPGRVGRENDVNALLFQFCSTCPCICWAYSLGSPLDDVATHLIRTDDEGYAVSGFSHGFGPGFPNLMVAKWSEKREVELGGLTCIGEDILLDWVDVPVTVTQVAVEAVALQLIIDDVSLISDASSFTETPVCTWICGDANGDLGVTQQDLQYLANYLFAGGPPPVHPLDPNEWNGWEQTDLQYLANYLFGTGPPPCAL